MRAKIKKCKGNFSARQAAACGGWRRDEISRGFPESEFGLFPEHTTPLEVQPTFLVVDRLLGEAASRL